MRKFFVVAVSSLALLALVPQAQAHDQRTGAFVAGAVTGAAVTRVLATHHDGRYQHGPRVVEYRHYRVSPRLREVRYIRHQAQRSHGYWHRADRGHRYGDHHRRGHGS